MTQNVEHDNCDEDFGHCDLPDLVHVESREKFVPLFNGDADLEVHVDQGQQWDDRVKRDTGHVSHEDIHPGGSQGCRHQLDFLATLLSGDFETSENVNQEGKQEYEQNGQPTRSVSSVKICSVKQERDIQICNIG